MYIVEEQNAKLIEKHSKILNMYKEYAHCTPKSNNDHMHQMLNQTHNLRLNSNDRTN